MKVVVLLMILGVIGSSIRNLLAHYMVDIEYGLLVVPMITLSVSLSSTAVIYFRKLKLRMKRLLGAGWISLSPD